MFLSKVLVVLVILVLVIAYSNSYQCPNSKTDLRSLRRRRHLTFPEGSVASITISLAKSFPTHVPSGWYTFSDMDVLYPLPPANFTNAHFRRKVHHRQRREFWERMKSVLDMHNMDGYACLLRTVCEVKTHLAPPGTSLVHDILRAIFIAPIHEEEFIMEMGGMYEELYDPHFCDKVFDCSFSLVHFVLEFNKR